MGWVEAHSNRLSFLPHVPVWFRVLSCAVWFGILLPVCPRLRIFGCYHAKYCLHFFCDSTNSISACDMSVSEGKWIGRLMICVVAQQSSTIILSCAYTRLSTCTCRYGFGWSILGNTLGIVVGARCCAWLVYQFPFSFSPLWKENYVSMISSIMMSVIVPSRVRQKMGPILNWQAVPWPIAAA